MAICRLREGARAREEAAIDEDDERPQRRVLGDCQRDRESPLVDVDSLPHSVEGNSEERTVRDVDREAQRTSSSPEKQHVRVTAAEHTLIQGLL